MERRETGARLKRQANLTERTGVAAGRARSGRWRPSPASPS